MNKILLVIIALIAILGAFTFLGNKKTTPVTSTQSIAQPTVTEANNLITTVVTLTNTGFSPQDITVKAGTKVIWTNKSGKAATVDSANHPTHLLYPFLNLGEFANDSSVQAVFDKAGKYSYHNHLNSSEKGSVTVE